MTTVIKPPEEELDDLMEHSGTTEETKKKKRQELDGFKKFVANNYPDVDFDEDLLKDTDMLQRVMVAYFKGIRVKDKTTKELISPKGSYLAAKMSFLKCEINRLTGYDFSNAGLYSKLKNGTKAIKKKIKEEGRADVTHHPKIPLDTTKVKYFFFCQFFRNLH